MLVLDHLTRRYGTFTAVNDLSLHIEPGRIFGFLGPNGAGKTTTMKMIVGLIKATEGRIVVDGIDVAKDPLAARRRIGYVPDRPHVYERLSAVEYMYFVGALYRIPKAEAVPRTSELLTLFGLAEKADALVESFSHGMKQRLVMASVLLHRPRLLIVDEPMVGLDPQGARLLKDVLRREAASGLTVMLSTHTLEVAEEVCDTVGVIHRGRLLALDTPTGLKAARGAAGERLEAVFLALTAEAEAADQARRFA